MKGEEEETLFGRRSGKSAAAFRTISEVAAELEVPTHVLRFWEGKFSGVRPLKRGGGRRYYRPEDVDLLRRIRRLLYEQGYTIKGAQRVLRDEPDDGQEALNGEGPPPLVTPNGEEPPLRTALSDLLEELRQLRDILDRSRS